MRKLHAATGPNRATGSELLSRICNTSTPAPYAIIGKSARNGNLPWNFTGAFRPGDNTSGM